MQLCHSLDRECPPLQQWHALLVRLGNAIISVYGLRLFLTTEPRMPRIRDAKEAP